MIEGKHSSVTEKVGKWVFKEQFWVIDLFIIAIVFLILYATESKYHWDVYLFVSLSYLIFLFYFNLSILLFRPSRTYPFDIKCVFKERLCVITLIIIIIAIVFLILYATFPNVYLLVFPFICLISLFCFISLYLLRVWSFKVKDIRGELLDFSGARFIWEMIRFSSRHDENQVKPKTIGIWLIAAYLGLFSIGDIRYTNAVDRIMFRCNALLSQLSLINHDNDTDELKTALGRIRDIQEIWSPLQPNIRLPHTVIATFFLRSHEDIYDNTACVLRDTVSDYRKHLDGVNLSGAWLHNVNLQNGQLKNANLSDADLSGADLSGATLYSIRNWSVEQLCQAKSLYKTKFDPVIERELRARCLRLFRKPDDAKAN